MSTKQKAIDSAETELVTTALKLPTKSAQIRALAAGGMEQGVIAQVLTNHYGKEVRYQHVRNVLVTKIGKEA